MPLRAIGIDRVPRRLAPRRGSQRAVGLDDGADRQRELAPPRHVGDVAEGADHRDAAALGRIGECVRLDRHADAEQRRFDLAAEQRLVAVVVRVRDERNARWNQLRPRRLDVHRRPAVHGHIVARGNAERDPVIRARHVAVFEFRLRDRGLEVHVPQRRRFHLVREAAPQQAEERELRHALRALADGRVRHRPVHRQAEVSPQVLERFLVLDGQPPAQLDEVRPRDRHRGLGRRLRRRERRIVGERRVAPDAVVVLHAPLRRQPVVVPAHGIEHGLAAHAVKASDQIGVGEREDVTDVQRAADRGRRRVDGVHVAARTRSIEAVHAGRFPDRRPLRLEPFERRLLGQAEPRRIEHPKIVLQVALYLMAALMRSISSRTRRSASCDTRSPTASRTDASIRGAISARMRRVT